MAPAKPTMMAVQRRQPIASCRISPAPTVAKSGVRKPIACTSPTVVSDSAPNQAVIATKPVATRTR